MQEDGQGCMVSDADNSPCVVAASFVGQVIQLHSAMELSAGKEVDLEICTASVKCRVSQLLQKIDRRCGVVLTMCHLHVILRSFTCSHARPDSNSTRVTVCALHVTH
jgi:hypothetical protein